MSFGLKLRNLRNNKKLSQRELAEILEVNRSSIGSYEINASYPSIEVLVKMCRFFNVSADYLMDLTDENRVDVDKLSEEQVAAIAEVINQFVLLNNQNKDLPEIKL